MDFNFVLLRGEGKQAFLTDEKFRVLSYPSHVGVGEKPRIHRKKKKGPTARRSGFQAEKEL